ncbi:MAG: hypothetical protein LRY40_01955 [Shewanella fodinae]|nr:hypothetical protein [Shewanella fodinae]
MEVREPGKYAGLGGRSLTSRLVQDEVPADTHALSAENRIVAAIGLLSGTGAANSGRISIGAKSPLTGGIKESNSGGSFCQKLARLDILALVLEDKPEPNAPLVNIVLTKDGVRFDEAGDMAGKGTYACMDAVSERYGKKACAMLIGPAGESLLTGASIQFSDPWGRPARAAGRGGLGAVMGSKNLKGVGIRGTGTCTIKASRDEMRALDDHILGIIGSNNNNVVPSTPQSWAEYYSSGSRWKARDEIKWGAADEPVELGEVAWNERNRIGYRCSMAEMYVGVEYTNKWLKRMGGCHACPIRCYCEMKVPELKSRFKFKSEYITNTCGGFIWGNYLMPTTAGTEQYALTATAGAYLRDDYGIFSGYGLTHHILKI